MSASNLSVTFEEVQQYDWQSVPDSVEERARKYDKASTKFFQKAASLREANDELGERVFRFLGAVTSLHPSPESKDEPFRPEVIDGTRRSAALEDFTEQDASVLARLAVVTSDPELKARFADVAATQKFDHRVVREAVRGYLASAQCKEDCEKWPIFIQDLERAAQLASKLGNKQQPFLEVMQYVENLVAKFSPTDAGLCCCRLLELMQEFGYGDAYPNARLSETLAERAESNKNPLFARNYWELAVGWYRLNNDEENAQRCATRAAETHVLDAEAALARPQPSYMASAHHLALAVEALRRSNAPKERVEEVHRLLLKRQKRIQSEIGSISRDVEIGPVRQKAQEIVRGRDLRTAIILLATSVSPIDPNEHRKDVEKLAKDHPISFLFSASAVDREGRVVGHRPSLLTTDPSQYDTALWVEMVHQASTINWPFRVQSFIDPCRRQIWREHQPRVKELRFLVEDHPFVPPGHELSYARGFHAGFEGDLLGVAYYLVPQVEPSIRYLLENHGLITSKLNDKLIQEVRSLEKLLTEPETTRALGEAHVFELRGSLTEKFGGNLRNRLAHGLLSDGECYTMHVMHLWWLLLRLCVAPLPSLPRKAEVSDDMPNSASGGEDEGTTLLPKAVLGVEEARQVMRERFAVPDWEFTVGQPMTREERNARG